MIQRGTSWCCRLMEMPHHPDWVHSDKLISDCGPASFGLGDKGVIYPQYRKAVKLDPEQFATSFHPAGYGIVEYIERILLPSISDEKQNNLQLRKVHAELYKLNAYSGPSGLFRKHVDTPRSENQVGSLVVCFPSPFKGGNLTVRHHGQKVEFDWSERSASTIQWAAFYGDCEHEIDTITEGDRVTLTYNLYVTEPQGALTIFEPPVLNPKTLPLYNSIKDLLKGPGFLHKGGVLGFSCSHAYPHASEYDRAQLPRALKGADLVLYSVFRSLGIEVTVLPILEIYGAYGIENLDLGFKGKGDRWNSSYEVDDLISYLEDGESQDFQTSEMKPITSDAVADLDRYWKLLLLTRRVEGMDDLRDFARKKKLPLNTNSFYNQAMSLVGSRPRPYTTTDWGEDMSDEDVSIM